MTGKGQTWKAGWVQALAGSNPAFSANCESARDGVAPSID
jgi:hypothetical protein